MRIGPGRLAGARVLCSFAGPVVPDEVLGRLRSGRAAGVLLFAQNLPTTEQAVANATAIQEAAAQSRSGLPAIIALDQEGGIVKRLPGPPSASAAEMGTWPRETIREEARATGETIRDAGAHVDLAPVADVARTGGSSIARAARSAPTLPRPQPASLRSSVGSSTPGSGRPSSTSPGSAAPR